MTATRAIKPFGLRMNPDVKAGIEDRAAQNGRSLNSEINQILKGVLTGAAEQAAFERGRLAGIQQAMNP